MEKYLKVFAISVFLLLLIMTGIIAIRFFSGSEDAWICENGEWVAHGHPAFPVPVSGCGDNDGGGGANVVGGDKDEHGCIGSAGYVWCESRDKCLRQWEEFCDTGFNFIKNGVAIKNSPGLKEDVWYLLYEEPGKPAITRELIFDNLSFCGDKNGNIPCAALSVSDYGLRNGRSVTVEGAESGDVVNVRLLEMEPY